MTSYYVSIDPNNIIQWEYLELKLWHACCAMCIVHTELYYNDDDNSDNEINLYLIAYQIVVDSLSQLV